MIIISFIFNMIRMIEESSNDANDRSIVFAAKYFKNVLCDTDGEVLFITNDFANMVNLT